MHLKMIKFVHFMLCILWPGPSLRQPVRRLPFSHASWGSCGKNTGVVCHFLLQWTAFCQSSPLRFVLLGFPSTTWLIASLSCTSPFPWQGCDPQRGWDSITGSMGMNLSKSQEIVEDRGAWHAAVHGVAALDMTWRLNNHHHRLAALRWAEGLAPEVL